MMLTVIYRTNGDSEAHVIRSLLEAHGIHVMLSSALTHTVFPLTVDGLGEVRVSVPEEEADEARRILAEHRNGLEAPPSTDGSDDPSAA